MDKTRYASICDSKRLEKYTKKHKIEGCTNICIFFIQEPEHICIMSLLYSIDELAMSLTVPIVFLSMLFLEMAMVIKRKDRDLDWANDNSS